MLYVLTGEKQQGALLKRLGKHKTGKSCLYLNTLADVDEAVLAKIIAGAWAHMQKNPSVSAGAKATDFKFAISSMAGAGANLKPKSCFSLRPH
ncbi:MAG: DUF1801 domain-containing protein [Terricaulis sp.]|nr:DUF1801 domain-containing protein [Terricaulis sp.]